MSLLLLDYDTFAAVAFELHANALLNLAFTCRTMRQTIIPEFLYARICFSLGVDTMDEDLNLIHSFYRSIAAYPNGSTAGDAVRNLERLVLSGGASRIASIIASRTRLQHLDLSDALSDALTGLEGLSGLTTIKLAKLKFRFDRDTYTLSREAPLGQLLFNFRHTLESITDDFTWLSVHTFELHLSVPKSEFHVDLAHFFPSTCALSLRTYSEIDPWNIVIHYPTRLESFTGEWGGYMAVVEAGAELLHARIKNWLLYTPTKLAGQFQVLPSIQSLSLTYMECTTLPSNLLEHVVEHTPNLQFFLLTWELSEQSAESEELPGAIEKMTPYMVRLPPRYLGFSAAESYWPPIDVRKWERLMRADLSTAETGFISEIYESCPSIEACCIEAIHRRNWPDSNIMGKYWRAREDQTVRGESQAGTPTPSQRLVEVSEELGRADIVTYEHRWKNR
ncbi:hypothetical protein BOTBODRAFT_177245 [Botryobasidium botryosum FD-172 SS1]|uniref:F-box domain-containing protein n=1 Tax=Botryobasidium botryosum (strain FD-172 SS1) TaxID=930990 RepID=A0A067MIM7_BOTB1|nr:hypothetical protein BOTBODRAFT_177245 [Botryobasidium botryosum FD-172 SS1]